MKDDILLILWRVPTGLTLSRPILRSHLVAATGEPVGDGEMNTALAEMLRDGWIVTERNRRTQDEELSLTDLGRDIFTGKPAPQSQKLALRRQK